MTSSVFESYPVPSNVWQPNPSGRSAHGVPVHQAGFRLRIFSIPGSLRQPLSLAAPAGVESNPRLGKSHRPTGLESFPSHNAPPFLPTGTLLICSFVSTTTSSLVQARQLGTARALIGRTEALRSVAFSVKCHCSLTTNEKPRGKTPWLLRSSWWSRWGSNPRPPECHSGALPTELRPHMTLIEKPSPL
jgi:hypothetical protein